MPNDIPARMACDWAAGSLGMLKETRPVVPVAAVLFGERAPGGEVIERTTFALAEGGVGQVTTGRPRYPVHQLERRALSRPRAVTIDRVDFAGPLLNFRAQPPHPASLGQVGIFGDCLNAKIERVDEAPRCRQVRRRLHWGRRARRPCRVQGIDQHIVSAMASSRPYREISQIGQIANTPRLSGPHAVELGGQAPGPASAKPLRKPKPIRRHDERTAGLKVARAQMHAVVANRQDTGQHEARLADPAPVQIERRGEVLDLLHPVRNRSVLQLQPHFRGKAMGHVHPEPRLGAGAPHDGGRHPTCPISLKVPGQGLVAVLFGAGGNAERGEHGDHRGFGNGHVPVGPVHIPGGDAESPGKFDQRGRERCHAAHFASSTRLTRHEGRYWLDCARLCLFGGVAGSARMATPDIALYIERRFSGLFGESVSRSSDLPFGRTTWRSAATIPFRTIWRHEESDGYPTGDMESSSSVK